MGQLALLMNEERSATFSDDRRYRYSLLRAWDNDLPWWGFVGLNPSTADEETDDHTIRRCRNIAKHHGAGGIVMVNLFAYRSTDPKGLIGVADPIGRLANDWALRRASAVCERMIAAWGNVPRALHFHGRAAEVRELLGFDRLEVLGLTKGGYPRHPSRLPGAPIPQPWRTRT